MCDVLQGDQFVGCKDCFDVGIVVGFVYFVYFVIKCLLVVGQYVVVGNYDVDFFGVSGDIFVDFLNVQMLW